MLKRSDTKTLSTGERVDLGGGASDYLDSDGTDVRVASNFLPVTDQSQNVGSATKAWNYGYFAALRDQTEGNNRIVFFTNQEAQVKGDVANSGTNVAVKFGNTATLNGTTEIAGFYNDSGVSTKVLGISHYGKLVTAATVSGIATLVGGSVTVSTAAVIAGSKIIYARNTTGGTLGHLSCPSASIVAGTSFVINSSSGTDTSTVNWFLVD